MYSLLKTQMKAATRGKSCRINALIDGVIIVLCWLVATLNPSILGRIEVLGGPIIAVILFLMPMYAIAKVPAMQKYRHPLTDRFVVAIGVVAISAIVYGLMSPFFVF